MIKQKHFKKNIYNDDQHVSGPTDAESMQFGESRYNQTIKDVRIKNLSTDDE